MVNGLLAFTILKNGDFGNIEDEAGTSKYVRLLYSVSPVSSPRIMQMKLRSLAVTLAVVCCSLPLASQSLDKKAPAALQTGENTGSVDSLIGAHYYYFWAEPGSLRLPVLRAEQKAWARPVGRSACRASHPRPPVPS